VKGWKEVPFCIRLMNRLIKTWGICPFMEKQHKFSEKIGKKPQIFPIITKKIKFEHIDYRKF